MILYSVNCKAPITNDEWSIVTIHKSKEGAEIAEKRYKKNSEFHSDDWEYTIVEIDTDMDSDIIYDCDEV